jgi:hypothetical protein
MDRLIQTLAVANDSADDPRLTGLYVLTLWYAGERDEARRVADNMRDEHRASAMAQLALDIHEAEKQSTQTSVQATAP